jgi:predicted site-specific integrase-resolvase
MHKIDPPEDPDDLIPTALAAEIHGVDVATINRWARAGRLPVAIKFPGKTGGNLYRRSDVEALLPSAEAVA